jgi:hypothetical protein
MSRSASSFSFVLGLAIACLAVQDGSAADRSGELLRLARVEFGELTEPEIVLFRETANGRKAILGTGDAADAAKSGDERVIPASRIRWLLTDPLASKEVLPHEGIWIEGARIEGRLDLRDARVRFGLVIDRSSIPNGMSLSRAHMRWISFEGTHIGSNGSKSAIHADGMRSDTLYFRSGFRADGELRLLGARIDGNLDFLGATLSNPGGMTLMADAATILGTLFMNDGFRSEGTLKLTGATVSGDLVLQGGTLSNVGERALIADGLTVGRTVFMRAGFEAEGGLDLTGARIRSFLHLRGIKNPSGFTLDLEAARVGTLWDEEESWPSVIRLDGFIYERIYRGAPLTTESRLRWLRLGDAPKFQPQPYRQLAKVLRQMGHEEEAKSLLVEMNEDPLFLASMPVPSWIAHTSLGLTMSYGYRPALAAVWMVLVVAVGAMLFRRAYRSEQLTRTTDGYAPPFNALMYSIDSFLPIIDFKQADYWLPSSRPLRVYLWFHIAAGWALSTLFAVGLTGLVRN